MLSESGVSIRHVSKTYMSRQGLTHALDDCSLEIPDRSFSVLVGPSGCGKTTLLNIIAGFDTLTVGEVRLGERIIAAPGSPLHPGPDRLVVFQQGGLFPWMTVIENVCYGPRIHGENNRTRLDEICERSLRQAALWDEVKDRLHRPALDLSGGQQQRMCIARVLAVEPEVILMDEPASALDPIATSKIEDLIGGLKKQYSVVIVTHSMQQAARISEYTAFFHLGEIVEVGTTTNIFTRPKEKRTEDYITGRFG